MTNMNPSQPITNLICFDEELALHSSGLFQSGF